MADAERRALASRAPVSACPACEDDGRHCRFGSVQTPQAPGPAETECAYGHRYVVDSWTLDERRVHFFVLRRRLDE